MPNVYFKDKALFIEHNVDYKNTPGFASGFTRLQSEFKKEYRFSREFRSDIPIELYPHLIYQYFKGELSQSSNGTKFTKEWRDNAIVELAEQKTLLITQGQDFQDKLGPGACNTMKATLKFSSRIPSEIRRSFIDKEDLSSYAVTGLAIAHLHELSDIFGHILGTKPMYNGKIDDLADSIYKMIEKIPTNEPTREQLKRIVSTRLEQAHGIISNKKAAEGISH